MKTYGFEIVNSEKMKQYINSHQEKEYMIIDVRQPFEYEKNHIPGALLNPLQEMIQSFSDLPADKDLFFYCHVGARSQMAAMTAAEKGIFKKDIYSLDGGISAWTGKSLEDLPRVGVFNKSKTLTEFLYAAMNMEKGAERFYRMIYEKYPSVAEGFVYTSDTNADWLTTEDLGQMISQQESGLLSSKIISKPIKHEKHSLQPPMYRTG